jgi:hypothetical protein
MKEKKKGVCQDCLDTFDYSQLYSITIASNVGPEHSIGLCKRCAEKRGKAPLALENMQAVFRRMNKYLGLGG